MKYILLTSILLIINTSFCQVDKFVPEMKANLSMEYGEKLIKQCSRFSVEKVDGFFNIVESEITDLEVNFKKLYKLKSTNCCNKGYKISDLKHYGYQYVGVIVNGEKYIYINAFDIESSEMFLNSDDWKTKPLIICDGGPSYWGVLYNIKKKKFKDLSMNGSI